MSDTLCAAIQSLGSELMETRHHRHQNPERASQSMMKYLSE